MRETHCKYCNKELVPNKKGRPRKFCDSKCLRRFRRLKPCEICGEPAWQKRCQKCFLRTQTIEKQHREAILWNQILDFRREGLYNVEIAVRLKRTDIAINSLVQRMKKAGIDVPKATYDPSAWMDKWIRVRAAKGIVRSSRTSSS
jgi:hypothetical protein